MRKITILLHEIGDKYAVKYIDPHDASLNDPDFIAISPTRMLPALFDSDNSVALFESGAILQYLAEKSGRFLSSDKYQRAETIKWVMFEAANLCPAMIELHHYLLSDEGNLPASIFDRYKSKVTQYCDILDRQLQSRDYLAGEYSIADMAIYPWTVALEDLADINLNNYKNLSAWINRLDLRTQQVLQIGTDTLATNDWCFEGNQIKECNA